MAFTQGSGFSAVQAQVEMNSAATTIVSTLLRTSSVRRAKALAPGGCEARSAHIWFAPELPTQPDSMNVGLRQYTRPLSGTVLVPGHDGLRAPRSS